MSESNVTHHTAWLVCEEDTTVEFSVVDDHAGETVLNVPMGTVLSGAPAEERVAVLHTMARSLGWVLPPGVEFELSSPTGWWAVAQRSAPDRIVEPKQHVSSQLQEG